MGKDFKILNNEVYPSTLVSIGTGLTTAGVITYGSVDFIIDGLSGHLLNDPSVTNRMVSINWGVTSGKFAGPPRNFKLCNLHIPESSIIVYTSGSDNWLNTTELSNITCSRIQWRGLPSSSKFNNISTKELDVIGQHLATEGEGGAYILALNIHIPTGLIVLFKMIVTYQNIVSQECMLTVLTNHLITLK
ncbi:UNVERIFIED_ORG: hypothetical protein [Escherichia phage CMSTMSU]